jgi:tetratricopeptide (TPR) repeat protein
MPALIVVAGLAAYSNTFANPFIVDDSSSVVLNSTIRDLSSWRVIRPPADHPMSGRPLVNVSFAINHAVGGTDVAGYHAVNLALHLACGLLVFGLVGRQLSRPQAGAVALLWTVHPLNSEVVSYVTQRTESMMALCFLATMYAASARGLSRPRAQIVAVVTCALGMLCKETMAVAPLAVLLYDSAYEFGSVRAALRSRWRFYGCLASTWLIVAVMTATSGQSINAGYTFARADPWVYLLNQGQIILQYLRLAIWPDSLVLYYGWPRAIGLGDVWGSVLVVGLLVVATLVALVRWPRIGALGAWVFLTLGPTSSLVPIVTEVGAERRMYLPLIGVITLAVVGASWFWSRLGDRRVSLKWAPAAIVAVLVTASSVTTYARNREYASLLTMVETIRERWPTPYASYLVGAALVESGRVPDALPHLREAAAGYPMARYGLADALFKTKQFPEAIAEGEAFLRVAPPPAVVNARMLLAQAYVATRQYPEAIEHLTQVLAVSPRSAPARALLADLLAETRRFDEAVPHYQALLAAAPQNAQTAASLGVALVAAGRGAEAVTAFRTAAAAEPGNARYCQNLARALVDHGDAAEALAQAQQAVTLDSRDPVSFEVLGWALARMGRTQDARLSFSRALQLDPTYAPAIAGLRALGR